MTEHRPAVTPPAPRAAEGSRQLGEVLQELTEARRLLRTVIDNLPAMVGYWDRDLRNLVANRAYLDWFGQTPEELTGKHIRDLLGEDLFALNLPYLTAALAGEEQHFDRAIVDPTGRTRYSQASYVPDVRADGTVAGIFVLVADVSDRVLAEQALAAERERASRLADQLRIVSRVSTSLNDLDVTTVHEVVADAVLELGYDGVSLVLRDPLTGAFTPTYGRGLFSNVDGIVSAGAGSTGAVLRDNAACVVPDYQAHPNPVEQIHRTGVRTTVSVPVRDSSQVVAVLHAGYAEVRPVTEADKEVLSLLADITGTALDNAQRHERVRVARNRYALDARTDSLTGVGNRRTAESALASSQPGDVVVIVDLDGFKRVNDELGHAAGDDVLRRLAALLRSSLRVQDEVARLGGDEFLLHLPDTSARTADALLHRLRREWRATEPVTTFSAGCAQQAAGESPESLYQRADQALYRAKGAGRDQHVVG